MVRLQHARKQWRLHVVLLVTVAAGLIAVLWFSQDRVDYGQRLADAERALKHGQFEFAAQQALQVYSVEPSPKAARIVGEAFAKSNRFDDARIYFQRAAGLEADAATRARDFTALGECCVRTGELTAAELAYRSAVDCDPSQTLAEDRLEWLLRVEGRLRESRSITLRRVRSNTATFEQLLNYGHPSRQRRTPEELLPHRARLERDGLPVLALAQDAVIDRNSTDALRYLRLATRQFPENSDAQVSLGRLLMEEDPAAFVEWFRQLPESLGDDGDIWLLRGMWAERQKDFEGAAASMFRVLTSDQFHRDANFHMAAVLTQLGFVEPASSFRAVSDVQQETERLLDDIYDDRNSLAAIESLIPALLSVGRKQEAVNWQRLAEQRFGSQPRINELSAAIQSCAPVVPAVELARSTVDFDRFPVATPRLNPQSVVVENGTPSGETQLSFRSLSQAIGFEFQFANSDHASAGRRMIQSDGGGIGICDLDGDLWPDVLMTQGGEWPVDPRSANPTDQLFRNVRGTQMASVSGLAIPPETAFGQGISVSDYDNDGFEDIFVCNVGANQLLHGNGDGTFSNVTETARISGHMWSSSCAFADINADGLDDLYVVNYLSIEDAAAEICHENGRLKSCSPGGFVAAEDQLLLNLGDGQFADITASAGVLQPDGRGLGIVAAHLDSDHRIDFFVANDAVPNFLFLNKSSFGTHRPAASGAPSSLPVSSSQDEQLSSIRFEESAVAAGVAVDHAGRPQACMGIAFADFDLNGYADLFVTNFFNEPNTLYLNQSGGLFVDSSRSFRLVQPSLDRLGFGTQALDIDLDGDDDFVVLNGHIDDLSADGVPYRMRPQIFGNRSGREFKEAVHDDGFFAADLIGRALATLDWNRDGRADLVAGLLDDPSVLLENTTDTNASWLRVSLVGTSASRSAIGATVTIVHQDHTLPRQLVGGGGFQASNEQLLVWGLGKNSQPCDVRIQWLDGREQLIQQLLPNRHYCIVQREGRNAAVVLPP